MANKQGRPKGYSPGPKRVITHQVGAWAWNTANLHKRIVKTTPDECWTWIGSKNQHGNIFGAYKNGRQQMTQANRILYMEQSNQCIDDFNVRMRCGNSWCSNPNHFELRPYRSGIKAERARKRPMMLIEETLHTEGHNDAVKKLTNCLKEFHSQSPFQSGLDWGTQTMWAKLTDEQCIMFCLKHPEYMGRFKPC